MGHERIRLIALIGIFSLSLFGIKGVLRYRAGRPTRQPAWSAIPYQLGEWSGTDGKFDPVYGTDPADTSLLRIYTRHDAPPVIAYVGFYGDLVKILEVHTPEVCYPAQGWTLLSSGKSVAGSYRGQPISAADAVVDKGGTERLVMWWYNAGGRPFETRIRYICGMLALSTLTGRKDGSMVRLEVPIRIGDEAGAREAAEEFQTNFLPALEKALPR
jgi:EpsI family protein